LPQPDADRLLMSTRAEAGIVRSRSRATSAFTHETHDATVLIAVLGVAGQALALVFVAACSLSLAGVGGPLRRLRAAVWGYELWLGFLVAALATGGSLFFSEIAHYAPCELCWYERICMYPLAIVMLLLALHNDHRAARYLLPLPVVGAGIAVYHVLVERGVVSETKGCALSAPGGCATRWIDEFGYVTIPVLTLTAFALLLGFLVLAGETE
jgi:disulfide bond formation protein DsbB